MHFDHGAEIPCECSVEAGDQFLVLLEQVLHNTGFVSDRDCASSNIANVLLSVVKVSFTLSGSTYRDSRLLSNSGAPTAATPGRVYDSLPVVANSGMRLNLSNAVVFALLTVFTSVTVIVMPASGM